jgi:hypothetical protein
MQKIGTTQKRNIKTTPIIGVIIGYDGYQTMNTLIAESVYAQQRKGVAVDVRATYVRA